MNRDTTRDRARASSMDSTSAEVCMDFRGRLHRAVGMPSPQMPSTLALVPVLPGPALAYGALLMMMMSMNVLDLEEVLQLLHFVSFYVCGELYVYL